MFVLSFLSALSPHLTHSVLLLLLFASRPLPSLHSQPSGPSSFITPHLPLSTCQLLSAAFCCADRRWLTRLAVPHQSVAAVVDVSGVLALDQLPLKWLVMPLMLGFDPTAWRELSPVRSHLFLSHPYLYFASVYALTSLASHGIRIPSSAVACFPFGIPLSSISVFAKFSYLSYLLISLGFLISFSPIFVSCIHLLFSLLLIALSHTSAASRCSFQDSAPRRI